MNIRSSVLKAIMEDVYDASDFDTAITIVEEHLEQSEIRESEGRAILIKAKLCGPSLEKLQKYLTNSWLKYEGMSV